MTKTGCHEGKNIKEYIVALTWTKILFCCILVLYKFLKDKDGVE